MSDTFDHEGDALEAMFAGQEDDDGWSRYSTVFDVALPSAMEVAVVLASDALSCA